jgi:hypothetical protein
LNSKLNQVLIEVNEIIVYSKEKWNFQTNGWVVEKLWSVKC